MNERLEAAKRSPLPPQVTRKEPSPPTPELSQPHKATKGTATWLGDSGIGTCLAVLVLATTVFVGVRLAQRRAELKECSTPASLDQAAGELKSTLERCLREGCEPATIASLASEKVDSFARDYAALHSCASQLQREASKADALAERLEASELDAAQLSAELQQLQNKDHKAAQAAAEDALKRLKGAEQKAMEASREAAASQRDIKHCSEARQAMQKALDANERFVASMNGKGDACWQALQTAQQSLWTWKLRFAASLAAAAGASALLLYWLLRRFRSKVWRLTSERARLMAALKMAQTGVQDRNRPKLGRL